MSMHGWHNKLTANRLESVSPITTKKIAEIATCSLNDYNFILERAEKAAKIWRETPAPQRGEIIHAFGQLVRQNKFHLANLITLEMGKSQTEALGEVQEIIDIADFAIDTFSDK